MRIGLLLAAGLLCAAFVLPASAAKRKIRPGDLYKATEAFLVSKNQPGFLKRVLIPVYRASGYVMARQLPGADKFSEEMASSLARLFDVQDDEFPYIAAQAFLSRPDLFDSSFKTLSLEDKNRAIAKLFQGWLRLKSEMERNPKISSSTRLRMKSLDRIINSWKDRYPNYLPKSWREDI